ncbi:hypothetical protein KHQ88_01505 [Mycoplasmatota bacterium]|nr:hypothetical protein KHQ88_01505 [Mycoplasmatota bacterium]
MWNELFNTIFGIRPYASVFIFDVITPYALSLIYFYKIIIKYLTFIRRRSFVTKMIMQHVYSYLIIFLFNFIFRQIEELFLAMIIGVGLLYLLYFNYLIHRRKQ